MTKILKRHGLNSEGEIKFFRSIRIDKLPKTVLQGLWNFN